MVKRVKKQNKKKKWLRILYRSKSNFKADWANWFDGFYCHEDPLFCPIFNFIFLHHAKQLKPALIDS